jgi:hypothetical protein
MIIGLEYAVCRDREEHSKKLANHYKKLLNAILIGKPEERVSWWSSY